MRVLLLLANRANRRLFVDFLKDRYEVVFPQGADLPVFDLCILDLPSLRTHWQRLEVCKRQSEPLFLPFLLVARRQDLRTTEAMCRQLVDEVLIVPIEKSVLAPRLESLLRTRGLSLQQSRLQEDARQSERLASGILEAAPDSMFIVDREGRVVKVNAQAEHEFGYRREEMIGRAIEAFMPERFRAAHVGQREQFTAAPHVRPMHFGLELYAIRKDGTEFPVEISLSPLQTPEGLWVIAALRDVTPRKRAERALRDSEAMLRAIVDNTTDMVFIKDRAGRFLLANRGVEKLARQGVGSLVGKTDYDAFDPKTADQMRSTDRQVMERRSLITFEDTVTVDGREHILLTQKFPYLSDTGELLGVAGISRDVTELRTVMAEAAARSVELKKAQEIGRLKDHFLSTVSHEMKTPLSLITGYTELLEDACPTPGIIEGIKEGSRRLTEHVEHLLDYSALLSGTMPLYQTDINLSEVVRHVADLVTESLKSKGLELVTEIDPATPVITGDFRRISQMLLELLENAEKFTPPGGRVGIRVGPTDHQVRLDVWDTGPGIPESDFGRIWEAFTQREVSDAFRSGGLGLGLAIVRKLADLHGGRVGLVSQVGKGATFSIFLPAVPTDQPQEALGRARPVKP